MAQARAALTPRHRPAGSTAAATHRHSTRPTPRARRTTWTLHSGPPQRCATEDMEGVLGACPSGPNTHHGRRHPADPVGVASGLRCRCFRRRRSVALSKPQYSVHRGGAHGVPGTVVARSARIGSRTSPSASSPPITRTDLIDEIEAVSDERAREIARRLVRDEGVFAGISTGANLDRPQGRRSCPAVGSANRSKKRIRNGCAVGGQAWMATAIPSKVSQGNQLISATSLLHSGTAPRPGLP